MSAKALLVHKFLRPVRRKARQQLALPCAPQKFFPLPARPVNQTDSYPAWRMILVGSRGARRGTACVLRQTLAEFSLPGQLTGPFQKLQRLLKISASKTPENY